MKLQKFSLLQICPSTASKPGEFVIHQILLGYHKATFVIPLARFEYWIISSQSSGSLQIQNTASVPFMCKHMLFVHQIYVERLSFPPYLGMTTNGITILVGHMIFELGFHHNEEWYNRTVQVH